MKKYVVFIIVLFFSFDALAFDVDFFPKKRARGATEVRLRFSEPIAPIGEPSFRFNPIKSIDCISEKVEGVWEEPQLYVVRFNKPLRAGLKCRVTLGDEIRSLKGSVYTGKKVFEFDTDVVLVDRIIPSQYQYSGIFNEQTFLVSFTGDVDIKKNKQNIYFKRESTMDYVDVELLSDEDTEKIIKEFYPYLKETKEKFYGLKPKLRFADGERVTLIFHGIESTSGVKTDFRQEFNYRVREGFKITLNCERETEESGCVPISDISVEFSSPVDAKYLDSIYLTDGKGRRIDPERRENDEVLKEVRFRPPFIPDHTYTLYIPKDIRDLYDRQPVNSDRFPLKFRVEKMPPLAKFPSTFGIVEMIDGEAVVPVTIRGLEKGFRLKSAGIVSDGGIQIRTESKGFFAKIWDFIRNLFVRLFGTSKGKKEEEDRRYLVPDVRIKGYNLAELGIPRMLELVNKSVNEEYGRDAFEDLKLSYEETRLSDYFDFGEATVIGFPVKRYGLYLFEIESKVLGNLLIGRDDEDESGGKVERPARIRSVVLVTGMGVTFKQGIQNSLVFVNNLNDGKPLGGVEVRIYDCKGKEYFSGVTNQDGVLIVDRVLPNEYALPYCEDYWHSDMKLSGGLTVVARRDGDMSFVNSRWDRGIESYRFNIFREYEGSPVRVHSVLSRNLLRAGERLHIRTYLKRFDFKGVSNVSPDETPERLVIEHPGSRRVWEFDIKWDRFGSSLVEWDIPKDAPTGYYNIHLDGCKSTGDTKRDCYYSAGSFSVEEFKVPLIKGDLVIREPENNKVRVDGLFNYLMGAPASDTDLSIRYRVQPVSVEHIEGFEGFDFTGERVKTGINPAKYASDEEYYEEEGYFEPRYEKREGGISELINLKTDEFGRFSYEVNLKKRFEVPLRLEIEAGYTDPNGYFYTISKSSMIYPSPYITGIKGRFDRNEKRLEATALVLSHKKVPLSGVPVKMNLYRERHYTHRKKVVGGFYSYETVREIAFVKEMCTGRTDRSGRIDCTLPYSEGGDYIIEAIAGSGENLSFASKFVYVSLSDDYWFNYFSDSDRVDLFADKKEYRPQEKMTIRVSTPFAVSTVLVTVERDGILDYFVRKLEAKDPYITIPVKPEYAPNVYISVVLVRGRVSSPPPTFLVDLAKPAFKMGLIGVNVDREKYRLNLKVSTDRDRYLVRDTVNGYVELGNVENEPVNVMLIVVDEGLLELKENNTYNILDGIITEMGYGVRTSTGLIQVIGKRHYGKKALPAGGGGGRIVTRELFDTLIYFNPDLKVSGNRAPFSFKLNDSITSFRIIAVAVSQGNRFGTGSRSIKSYREIFISSSIPYFAREGDRFTGEFVIKNTTDKERELETRGYVSFTKGGKEIKRLDLPEKSISLKPQGNEVIGFDIVVPENVDNGDYHLDLYEKSGPVDSIKVSQKIVKAYPQKAAGSVFFRLKGDYENVFRFSEDKRGGSIKVSVMRDVSEMGGSLKLYPNLILACLEQKVSYAIVANDYEYFNKLMNDIDLYIDENGLLKYYPSSTEGSVMLTAYILEITRLNNFQLPERVIERCVDGLNRFIMNRFSRRNVFDYTTTKFERLYALSAISPYINNSAELLNALEVHIPELPLSSILDVANITPRDVRITDAILSNFSERGGAMFLNENPLNRLWWLMRSEDEAFARALIYMVKNSKDETLLGKMMRGFMNRFERGYLYNTMAHAYAAVAFKLFSERFKGAIKESSLSVGYRCNRYTEKVDRDFTVKQFVFDILPTKEISGGLSVSDCNPAEERFTISDKNNNYWVWVLTEKEYELNEPVFKGFRIKKEFLDEQGKPKNEFKKTDIVRIRLTIDADNYYNNIVVKEPLITGSDIVGRIKKEDSYGNFEDYYWYYTYSDVRDGLIRTYYEHPYSKKIVFEYRVRLNTRGVYTLPPTRVELMYMPDVFGELPNGRVEVK